MPLEAATHIADLNTSNPVGSTDKVQTLDDHVRLIKSVLKTDLNLTGAVTATHTELNVLDGITSSTAELNILDGVTLTAAQINDAARLSAANIFTNGTQTIRAAVISQRFEETGAAANNANWAVVVNSEGFFATAYADDYLSGSDWLTVQRTGTTVDSIALAADSIQLTGTVVPNADNSGSIGTESLKFNAAWFNSISTNATLTIGGTGETLATFADDGAVTLYYDNSAKLDTKADGVNVVGELECDTLDVDGNVAIDGTLTTPGASASEVGRAGLPQTAVSGANYTLVLGDRNGHIYYTGAGHTITIPANASVAFPVGTTITFINRGSAAINIAITSDTLELAGSGAGGTRSLASPGVATAIKVTSTIWEISGTGLT